MGVDDSRSCPRIQVAAAVAVRQPENLIDRRTLMGNLFQPPVNQPLKPRGFVTRQIATKRPLANPQQKGRLPLGQTPRTPAVIGFFKSHLPELL
jgi:hypothetical protein